MIAYFSTDASIIMWRENNIGGGTRGNIKWTRGKKNPAAEKLKREGN